MNIRFMACGDAMPCTIISEEPAVCIFYLEDGDSR
jgi:hypothetical protein